MLSRFMGVTRSHVVTPRLLSGNEFDGDISMAVATRERQAKHRKHLKAQGKSRFAVTLDASTVDVIRKLAKEHDQTQATIIQVSVMLANRALTGVGNV